MIPPIIYSFELGDVAVASRTAGILPALVPLPSPSLFASTLVAAAFRPANFTPRTFLSLPYFPYFFRRCHPEPPELARRGRRTL